LCDIDLLVAVALMVEDEGLDLSSTKSLDHLERLLAMVHTRKDIAVVVQATEPDAHTTKILAALNIRFTNSVLWVTHLPAA
jgi:hypothetical protein